MFMPRSVEPGASPDHEGPIYLPADYRCAWVAAEAAARSFLLASAAACLAMGLAIVFAVGFGRIDADAPGPRPGRRW